MRRIRCYLIVCLLLFVGKNAFAQRIAISTNALDYLSLGTVNVEGGLSVAQHWSLWAGARINPWTWNIKDVETRNQQRTVWVGARWWPWYVYSGWWVGIKTEYLNYSNTGIWRPALQEGSGVGLGITGGYTRMLSPHWNIEFSLGALGGYLFKYGLYSSPARHYTRSEEPHAFLYPDNPSIAILYVF